MIIESDRLALRRIELEDAEFILDLLNQPSFLRFVGDRGVRSVGGAREYIRTGPQASYDRFGFGLYLTELKESGIPIGICGLLKRDSLEDVDLGFAFLPQFWSKGYALESASSVTAYARRSLGLQRIVAVVDPSNSASLKLLEKLGFEFERSMRLSPDAAELSLYGLNGVDSATEYRTPYDA